MGTFQILAGLTLLVLGRKLFWVFAGAAGFFVTYGLAGRYLQGQPDWLILLIAALIGVSGVILAVYVQTLAVGIAAFLAGGYYFGTLLEQSGISLGPFHWFTFAAGGLGACFLVVFLFEWALIVLSAFTGAALIFQNAEIDPPLAALVFFTLFMFGFGIQGQILRREDPNQRG